MRRGTTPKHIFTIPVDTGALQKIRVVYAQNGRRILTKKDLTISGNTVISKLTQEETFMFDHKKKAEVQLRALDHHGNAVITDIVTINVNRCLDTEVIK